MLCGFLPFEGDNNKELFTNILECNPEYPSFLSKKSKKLIQNLLKINPDERLTIEEIKKNEFYLKGKELCKIDYKLVENELEKRDTFYGNINKTFKINFFSKNNKNRDNNNINKNSIDDDKKIENDDNLNKISNNNSNNIKINLIKLITDTNSNGNINSFRQKVFKNNYSFKKKLLL